jgi:hypothetical protein
VCSDGLCPVLGWEKRHLVGLSTRLKFSTSIKYPSSIN